VAPSSSSQSEAQYQTAIRRKWAGAGTESAVTDTSSLRIAVVTPPWFALPPEGYGGIESMCHLLVEGLFARGHQVTLVGVGHAATSATYIRTYLEQQSTRIGQSLPDIIHAAAFAQHLRGLDVDVVHDHSLAGPLLAFGRDVPTVVTAHGPTEGEFEIYYSLISSAVSLVAISEAQRRMAPDLSWVSTVHNAIWVDEYPYSSAKEDFILWLGRASPDKGAHLAIDVAREVGTPIVLAGKCAEPEEEAYFAKEIEPRLGPDVEWTGEANAVRKKELLSAARCLLFPLQWHEPFGIVMVEAMACGTPVVALNKGSVPEIVEAGRTGFVCDDLSGCAEALAHLDEIDPAACRKRAEDKFDVDRMVAGYEDVYLRVLKGEVPSGSTAEL
jgi:glycosyltransferase involved in cell wall biosynthesis